MSTEDLNFLRISDASSYLNILKMDFSWIRFLTDTFLYCNVQMSQHLLFCTYMQ
mgnify:CR=1 FL=1